jgi:hypothetical protein
MCHASHTGGFGAVHTGLTDRLAFQPLQGGGVTKRLQAEGPSTEAAGLTNQHEAQLAELAALLRHVKTAVEQGKQLCERAHAAKQQASLERSQGRQPSLCPCFAGAPMRRPPASPLGGDADGATAQSTLPSLGGAPPSLAGAKKSLGGTGSPSKWA